MLLDASLHPALIARTAASTAVVGRNAGELANDAFNRFSGMPLLSDPTLDVRQYLEDLVSLAVNSARQAADLSAQAGETSRRARRGMIAVAGVGALGVLVGLAGFAAGRSSNVRLSAVHQEVMALQEMQRQTHEQLGELAASAAKQDAMIGVAQKIQEIVPSQLPPRLQSVSAPRVSHPPIRAAEPWPDARAPRPVAIQHTNAVVLPPFVIAIQRKLRAIFR